jgi:hypothetical protein
VSGTSLADWLREQSETMLVELLRARPDLAIPAPADSTVLATRAGTRASVARACDGLDAFSLSVLDALVLSDADHTPVLPATLARLLGTGIDPLDVDAAIARLRAQAIAWDGDGEAISVAPAAREVAGVYPAGLGPSAPQLDGVDLAPLLAGLDDKARRLLGTLAEGPPIGKTRDASSVIPAHGRTPVQELLAAGLLIRRDSETVELPRQVGIALRGGHPLGPISATEPTRELRAVDSSTVDSTGAGESAEFSRHTEALLNLWSNEPPPVLRSGGLGVREQRRLAKELDIDDIRATLVVELAHGAGLVLASADASPEWTLTTAADVWLAANREQRWATLAAAWLDLPRLPALAGLRDEKERLLAPLSDELRRPLAPRDRRRTLEALAELPQGAAIVNQRQLVDLLAWRAPRRGGRLRDDLLDWNLREARMLGIVALDAVTSAGRALLADGPAAAAKTLVAALPDLIDHLLVQADFTVIAPGPLEPDLAIEMGLVADIESAGSATVYRVSEASIRRALDAGRTSTELHELFKTRSTTPVPQALDYLIDDVARRHGRLRGGAAGSFLRCDDDALLTEVLANPVAARLELRRIAPTVVVSPLPLIDVLDSLRDAGFTPAAEGADGRVLDLRPSGRRLPARSRAERQSPTPPSASETQLIGVAKQIKVGDRASASRSGHSAQLPPGTGMSDTSATLGLLQQAVRGQRNVWVGFVDAYGVASQRFIAPVSIGGGVLEGMDHGSGELRRFALHRITSVEMATES